jgi:two-component system NtrC family response regulator
MDKSRLLVVDDDENIRIAMKWALSQDYQVLFADNRVDALAAVRAEKPPVVTLDLGLPPQPRGVDEGFRTLNEMLEVDPFVKVIIITGRDEKENAIKAVGQGAYDFFCKPIEVDELKVVLRRAFHVHRLEKEHRELHERFGEESFEGILGTSPQMQEVFTTVQKVAGVDVPVLITGESGTGKELVARAIHRLSGRRQHPFVAINCGAIPESLLESELFGHEKGAFTGAHAQRKGHLELARGGTLLLDEIGDLPLPLQVKLLRFLQEQRLVRVGGREEIAVDVRVLAATNSDLEKSMREGRFREDLFFRIGVIRINLPPLREREGDILLLAKMFLTKYTAEAKKRAAAFTPQALRALEIHGWPGNVRELENRIKRAVIMAEGTKLTPASLELELPYARYEGQGLKEAREALERELIQKALNKHKGKITQVAAELGISRPTLYELMEKLGIERSESAPRR